MPLQSVLTCCLTVCLLPTLPSPLPALCPLSCPSTGPKGGRVSKRSGVKTKPLLLPELTSPSPAAATPPTARRKPGACAVGPPVVSALWQPQTQHTQDTQSCSACGCSDSLPQFSVPHLLTTCAVVACRAQARQQEEDSQPSCCHTSHSQAQARWVVLLRATHSLGCVRAIGTSCLACWLVKCVYVCRQLNLCVCALVSVGPPCRPQARQQEQEPSSSSRHTSNREAQAR
jgi:hypothetical protein